jgi:hypothetical protein
VMIQVTDRDTSLIERESKRKGQGDKVCVYQAEIE